MNGWVYDGFNATYHDMGVSFDKLYYESDTYLLGKKHVEAGLKDGVFFQKGDGSIWVDLTDDGLDEKLLLRGDGTAVYMTQDIGTAILRFEDCPELDRQVYTVGNEQEYHFKVLFLILKKLGFAQADKNHHLSYGMVELPEGKMKSREGTVVDADDLLLEMRTTARSNFGRTGQGGRLQRRRQVRIGPASGARGLEVPSPQGRSPKIHDVRPQEQHRLFWQHGAFHPIQRRSLQEHLASGGRRPCKPCLGRRHPHG